MGLSHQAAGSSGSHQGLWRRAGQHEVTSKVIRSVHYPGYATHLTPLVAVTALHDTRAKFECTVIHRVTNISLQELKLHSV